MNIAGKLFGAAFGLMFGGFIGMIFGIWLGHRFDQAMLRNSTFTRGPDLKAQQLFLDTTFSVMGHIAKSKGAVTQQEIHVANLFMDQMRLHGAARTRAQEAFRRGKDSEFPLEQEIQAFVKAVHGNRNLLQMFMEIQLQGVFADGIIDDTERALLSRVASCLGFTEQQLAQMIRRWEAEVKFHQRSQGQGRSYQSPENSRSQLKDAYQILGVTEADSDQQVKRAYRKLMNQHHPDKLVAKGLPPEMMEQAKQHAQNIQQAYELVKTQRKFR